MVESDYQELIRQGASLRRKSGLTVTEIANRIEVSQPQVSRIESGKHAPKLDTFASYLDSFGFCLSIVPKDGVDELELFSSTVNDLILTESNSIIETNEKNKEFEAVLQRLRVLNYYHRINAYSDALRSHAKGWKDSGSAAENVADKQSDDAGNSSENGGGKR